MASLKKTLEHIDHLKTLGYNDVQLAMLKSMATDADRKQRGVAEVWECQHQKVELFFPASFMEHLDHPMTRVWVNDSDSKS